jgi:hypothetical protein
MKVLLQLDGRTDAGGSPLIMHNERMADPLEPYAREVGAIAHKRKKTEADHLEIARLEFLGGMYTNENGPCLPSWNILRSLQDGATRHKRGRDVLRGVAPIPDDVDLHYDGDEIRDAEILWKGQAHHLRKTVGVQRARTMRTRPFFTNWSCELEVEVDPVIFDLDSLAGFFKDAGIYCGLGDRRPINGRYAGTLKEMK